jgi:pimeloyl-ACP methyl ester carboxylesterase
MPESAEANLYVYPAEADYDRVRPLGDTWHRIDSSVRETDGDYLLPAAVADRPDGSALVYLSLGSLGGADVDLMRRLVDVLGHSYGGRCALGASLLTDSIRRVVAYEGAPVPAGSSYRPDGLLEAVRASLARGDPDAALSGFLAGVVGMSDAELDRYRAEPVWPTRVAAAHTILRELEAETSPGASIEALAAVRVPVLLILGGTSRSPFGVGTRAFADRLADAEVVTIEGAAHAAHHTHVAEFVAAVEAFLDG